MISTVPVGLPRRVPGILPINQIGATWHESVLKSPLCFLHSIASLIPSPGLGSVLPRIKFIAFEETDESFIDVAKTELFVQHGLCGEFALGFSHCSPQRLAVAPTLGLIHQAYEHPGVLGFDARRVAVRWLWVTFRPFHACASRTTSLIRRGERHHIDLWLCLSKYHLGRGCCWSKLVVAPPLPVRFGWSPIAHLPFS